MSALANRRYHVEERRTSADPADAPSRFERAFGLAIVAGSVIILVVNVVWLVAIGYLLFRGEVALGLVATMGPIPVILIATCFATGRCGRGLMR